MAHGCQEFRFGNTGGFCIFFCFAQGCGTPGNGFFQVSIDLLDLRFGGFELQLSLGKFCYILKQPVYFYRLSVSVMANVTITDHIPD